MRAGRHGRVVKLSPTGARITKWKSEVTGVPMVFQPVIWLLVPSET